MAMIEMHHTEVGWGHHLQPLEAKLKKTLHKDALYLARVSCLSMIFPPKKRKDWGLQIDGER